jgi:hypothetical protein
MMTQTKLTGPASDLLGALAQAAGEHAVRSKTWPDNPRAVAGRLRRAAPLLRKIGIEVVFKREGHARTRIIDIRATPPSAAPENAGAQLSSPSASSAPMPKSNPTNGSEAAPPRTAANNADGSGRGHAPTDRTNPLKSNGGTAADGADANFPSQSASGKAGDSGWRAKL